MKEFSRIFRTDPVSEKLNALISEELDRQEDIKMVQLRQSQVFTEDFRNAQIEEYGQDQIPQMFEDIIEGSDEEDYDEDQIISIDNDGTADKIAETEMDLLEQSYGKPQRGQTLGAKQSALLAQPIRI